MEHGNMLAIVGSPGSGKTTLAVKLAAEIAKKKKNVVVVCSDPFVPSVPFLLPMDMEQEVSLGALLTSPALTQNEILEACVSVPANEYISLLGYRMGENLMSYPKVTRERAVEFLVCLRHLADYVILDFHPCHGDGRPGTACGNFQSAGNILLQVPCGYAGRPRRQWKIYKCHREL